MVRNGIGAAAADTIRSASLAGDQTVSLLDRFAGLRVAGHQVASGAGTTVLALGPVRARERPVVRGRFQPDIEGFPSDRLRAYEAGVVSDCDDEEVTGEDRDYRWRAGRAHGR
ncbi:hypothetical protein NSND_62789 [Nitrospira sp. ND1]|nr:hypothetical protein NSND_62789 [Nitrospira sp. ND1]